MIIKSINKITGD